MAELKLDGNNTGAIRAIEETSDALGRLDRKAKATNVAPDGARLRQLSTEMRGVEAAGRVLGGRIGELTGMLGDMSDVAEAGLGPLSALGLAAAAGAVSMGALAIGSVKATQAAIDLARESGTLTNELRDADAAITGVSDAVDQLVTDLGSALAPEVASAGYALIGLISVARETAGAVSDLASSSSGRALLALSGLGPIVAVAGTAFERLEARGRAAAKALEDQRIAAADLFKAYESPEAKRAMRTSPVAQEAQRPAGKPYDPAIEAERIRLEIIRGLREAELSDLRAYEAEAASIQIESADAVLAADRIAAEQSAQLAKEHARAWADSYDSQRASAFAATDAIVGLISDLVGENREAAIAMFITRKALALAEIAVNTQVAATRAVAELGPIAGPPAAVAIQASGLASGAIVAAQSVAEGVSTFGSQQSQSQSNTYNLVVDSRTVRGAVRPHGAGSRRPAGQR